MPEPHPFLPNLEADAIETMLRQVKASSLADLFTDIPPALALKRKLAIPEGKPEAALRKEILQTLSKNVTPPAGLCFLGGGVWPHYVPAAVDSILSRQEFYTSYTPYQPEISQGMLQALFEYQSLVCDLLGMKVCNSSMYDWASAAGEAVRMATRVKGRKRFLLAQSIGQGRRDVIETYVQSLGLTLQTVDLDAKTGQVDAASLRSKLSDEVAGIYLENPNIMGVIEEGVADVVDAVHNAGGLVILGVDPVSLSVLRDPGSYGVDVVVGDGQPLGIPMNYGGPHIGIFAVRDQALARSMPGRLIGMTTTKDGKNRAFCMVLQTREQHIRREGATSNICTNQALLALAATVYLSLLGKAGFRRLGETILANSHYAAARISELKGVKAPVFDAAFFSDFTVRYGDRKAAEVYEELGRRGILGGYPLTRQFQGLGEIGSFCVSEVHSAEEIGRLVDALAEVL